MCGGGNYYNENGIVILTSPSHTSNNWQPLDSAVFGPFKCFFCGCTTDTSICYI